MTTEQTIWTVVIVVVVLALIAFIVSTMRKKSQHTKETQAAELRQEAQQRAAVIPDAQVRAKESEAEAERARLDAERAEERARAARTEVDQHEATVEEQVRAADRLDPRVNHKADDYAPDTSSVIGAHAAERTTTEAADSHPSGASTGSHAADGTATRTTPVTDGYDDRSGSSDAQAGHQDAETIFDSRDSETTSAGTHTDTSADTSSNPDQHDGTAGDTGGSHRA